MNNYANNSNTPDWGGWIATIVCLCVFPPVGLVLLFRQLMGYSSRQKRRLKRHPYDIQREWAQGTQGHPYNGRQPWEQQWEQSAQAKNDRAQQQAWAQQQAQWNERTAQWEGGQPGGQQAQAAPGQQGGRRWGRGAQRPKPAPVDVSKGKGLVIGGGILAGLFLLGSLGALGTLVDDLIYFGIDSFFWENLIGLIGTLGFAGAGVIMVLAGRSRQKKAKRYKQYLALIGQNTSISILTLARNMEMSVHDVCDDLQDMLDTGVLPTGYVDIVNGRLVLSEEGYVEAEEAPQSQEAQAPQGADDDALLLQIRAVNDDIDDPVMSAKIDRIEEITRKILEYQRQHPNKDAQLRSFLNYYLPTTMKILRAYAQLEEQGIEGENISAAKARIESMMDKVVEGFEKQLDKLFQDQAMDITTDVQVLENMLRKDGLSGGEGITLEI